ncbi:acyltransferase family protein [Thiocystis violacea]|uniref:acyltransferase family protein n=1 Tax=Thiocystis violacea TaxID=13725 RepID=UPI001904507B|nr:acyltransferase [Thiocystis violacea]MBK1723994.1 acyltransferase [Thiocystis violacea]
MTSTAPPAQQGRRLGIDFLRAACILYVVGYWHLIPYTTALPGYANWLTEGFKYIALSTFVFCSGFLLARHRLSLDWQHLRSFYRRRLLRIYPLYLVTLILFGVFGIASARQVTHGALLISMLSPPAMPTLWFITMIMAFYLIAPLLIRTSDRLALVLGIGGLLMAALVAQHTWVKHIDLRILLYLPVFVLGILYQARAELGRLAERYRWPLLIALALMLPLSRIGNEWSVAGTLILMPLALVSAATMMVFSEPVASRLHGPSIRLLAYASFGLYLLHRLTFKAAIAAYFPADGWSQVAYLLLLVLPATILLAVGMQRAYDGLIENWGGKRH